MDEYDPDNFDWGDGEATQAQDAAVVHDTAALIAAALEAHEDRYGWAFIKSSDVKEQAKRLYKSKIIVKSKDDQEYLRSEFPAYNFVFDQATQHHDHPVSHLLTELNSLEMTYDLVRDNKVFIDLFGNSGKAKKYKQKCFVLYQKNTPKDYIRYQNPGIRDLELDMKQLCDPTSVLGQIDDIVCVHALYYLKMVDIARIVHTSKGRKLRALVHRHPSSGGYLNRGELKYTVGQDGIVRQTNVLTGEYYEHPSLEALFHQDSAKTPLGGVAWTTRSAGGDAFYIDFVGCDNEVAAEFVPLFKLQEAKSVHVQCEGVDMHSFMHFSWITYNSEKSTVTLWDTDLFKKLRRYVAGKARTSNLKRELFNLARRLTNEADIISIHGGGAHNVDMAVLSDYVEAAFYIDVRHELEVAISFAKKHSVDMECLNAYYEKGTLPKDFTRATKVMSKTAKFVGDNMVKPLGDYVVVPAVKASIEAGWVIADDVFCHGVGYDIHKGDPWVPSGRNPQQLALEDPIEEPPDLINRTINFALRH